MHETKIVHCEVQLEQRFRSILQFLDQFRQHKNRLYMLMFNQNLQKSKNLQNPTSKTRVLSTMFQTPLKLKMKTWSSIIRSKLAQTIRVVGTKQSSLMKKNFLLMYLCENNQGLLHKKSLILLLQCKDCPSQK